MNRVSVPTLRLYDEKELLKPRYIDPETGYRYYDIDVYKRQEQEQPAHMGEASSDYVDWIVDYICEHREPVNLLLCRAEGTSYEHFVHNMVEVEVESTLRYMEVLRRLGKNIPPLNRSLCHIIASGMFNGLFEIVIHDMPREQAHRDVTQFRTFYTAGWLELMGQ